MYSKAMPYIAKRGIGRHPIDSPPHRSPEESTLPTASTSWLHAPSDRYVISVSAAGPIGEYAMAAIPVGIRVISILDAGR
jgi:hypothetical protein